MLPMLSLGLLVFSVYHVVRASQEPPKSPPPVPPSRNPFRGTIAGSGVVEPRSENISLGSHLPGIVAEVFVKVGDEVRGPHDSALGSKLFRLDDRNLQAELCVRKANLENAKASLHKLREQPRLEEVPPLEAKVHEAKANVDDARDLFVRAERLQKSKAIGDEDVNHRRYALAVAEAQLAKAESDLALLKKGAWELDQEIARSAVDQAASMVKQTETELERLIVRAPVDGVILQRNVRPGEYVGVPPSQALLVLGDCSELYVRVDIDENDLGRFKPGLKGRATPRGSPSVEFPLEFVRVEPYLVPKKSLTGAGNERVDTRVLQVIYSAGAHAKLYVGQQLDVYLDASE
jgi:multidrug resistance efflux pump